LTIGLFLLAMKDNREIIIKDTPDLMAQEAARLFCEAADERASIKNLFTVALSGGTTPVLMNRLLAKEPYSSKVPWDKTHIFWVDERCVSYSHPLSNYGAAVKDLISKVPIPESNVHPMPVEYLPEKGSDMYQDELIRFFGLNHEEIPRFDLILLGIGKDGHTASLFPGQGALDEEERLVVSVKGGDPDVNRLSITLPVLNNAREIVFLVSGKQKARILTTVLENDQALLPAQKIRPVGGDVKWLIDRDAASMLSEKTFQMGRASQLGKHDL
jgi:6-phosphogluconolactonase